ncbi:hypothetical protein ACFL2Z_00090 [Candidatus Eisenbacteria bacterium]|uniref:Uncharacterized protein n=1 Tax=Eiseniibacteriota bacterium TaxID=2212470 RepID=A0ABV6YMK4_UNCEI
MHMLRGAGIRDAYENAKRACKADLTSREAGDAIVNLATLSLRFLEAQATLIDLVSRVPGKEYVTYKRNSVVARPANKRFFLRNEREVLALWESWRNQDIEPTKLAEVSYTVALGPCLAMELLDRGNKKGPATYFEYLIGHIVARALRSNPKKRAVLPIRGRSVQMTMDFLFDMGSGRPGIHMPVKMSTRERVVQAWSHQRLLDSAYGDGTYKGIMVLFSETKLNSRSLEVVEICVPDQWLAYQSLLATLDRIYYFDVPERYRVLTETFPDLIQIRQIGEFFSKPEAVLV